MPFQEVWNRSYCQAKEELVNILSEYPDEVAYIFKPPCVPLLRCAGCCGDEALHCVPVETANVTMQVGRVSSRPARPLVHTLCSGPPRLPARRDLEGEGRRMEVTGLQQTLRPMSFPPSTAALLPEPAAQLWPPHRLPYQLSRALA